MSTSLPNIEEILSAVPHLKRGTGGVVAILKDGELLGKKAWGYADIDLRVPMTTETGFPICSISKQMVCLAYESLLREPTKVMTERDRDAGKQMDDELHKLLPHLANREDNLKLVVDDLFNMQSGIRDYWAMTTLWGARPDDKFSMLHDAPQALARTKSFHFAPGTEYSYSNVNFHVLGRIMENVSGMSLAQILTERVFIPAGMRTAALCPNTNGLPLPIVGYEGNEKIGYFKATNRIEWAGDAGIAASLEDMIAYEKYLDRSLSDPQSLYAKTSKQQTFKDNAPASYGHGLNRSHLAETTVISHGGALRGFRHMRMQIPSKRINIVVFFNYEESSGFVAQYIAKKLLGWEDQEPMRLKAASEFVGDYLDGDTQLYVTVKEGEKVGTVELRYERNAEVVKLTSETEGETPSMKVRIEGDVLHAKRSFDNRTLRANRIPKLQDAEIYQAANAEYAGTYRCDESESTFTCTSDGMTLAASFDGFLGKGPIWLMRCVGKDVWAMGNPRGLDATPPGDWTIVFNRSSGGKIQGCTVGCWLARKVDYVKL
ncbi:beta-lactamase/transpeptidase-like protein [Acrodontium crateriforme]|uniref:Beta-lactamase/transpeptidase-like protein n=1 Tax=Acrodontium crateriforme TaxID=150365 RepID=A0AAQ3M1G1_9PEZI|nr:beta-lactamase/transpeptidase-like protein [Acrodontium crateriforme]